MKKVFSLVLLMVLCMGIVACGGGKYICKDCQKNVSKAYYDMKSSKEYVMCEDCARKYWMPLDYRTYRVK